MANPDTGTDRGARAGGGQSAQIPAQRGPTPGEITGSTGELGQRRINGAGREPTNALTSAPEAAPEMAPPRYVMRKLPQVTALFWTLKIIAVTVGEAGGDELGITLKLGYLFSAEIFFVVFVITVTCQIRAERLHPALFWTVIVATSLVGTEVSDGMDRGWLTHSREVSASGVGYGAGAVILTVILAVIFLLWWRSGQRFDVENIASRSGEIVYWTAILVSNTLGTAFGDWLSTAVGLGFVPTFGLLAAVLAVITLGYYLTGMNASVLFWVAFILTRPLGAAASDCLVKPASQGGAGWGTMWALVAMATPLIVLIVYQMYRLGRYSLELLPMPVHRLTGEPLAPNGKPVIPSGDQRTGAHLAATTAVGPRDPSPHRSPAGPGAISKTRPWLVRVAHRGRGRDHPQP